MSWFKNELTTVGRSYVRFTIQDRKTMAAAWSCPHDQRHERKRGNFLSYDRLFVHMNEHCPRRVDKQTKHGRTVDQRKSNRMAVTIRSTVCAWIVTVMSKLRTNRLVGL